MSPASAPASTQPPAIGVGGLRQGDRWEYTIVDSRNGRAASRAFEIEQVDGESVVERIELEEGRTLTAAHRSGAYMNMAAGMQFAPYYSAFQPGAAMGPVGNVRVEGGDACEMGPKTAYGIADCEIQAEFARTETVTVPAGTFDARVVRVEVAQDFHGTPFAARLNGVFATATFWISPDAGRIVKAVVKYEVMSPWTETMELNWYRASGQPKAMAR